MKGYSPLTLVLLAATAGSALARAGMSIDKDDAYISFGKDKDIVLQRDGAYTLNIKGDVNINGGFSVDDTSFFDQFEDTHTFLGTL